MTKVQHFIILILFSFPGLALAQDVHFSQYSFAPTLLSPALSGIFPSEFRGGALYKNQWVSVPVKYTSFLGYFDKKVLRQVAGNSVVYGVSFQYDRAGEAALSGMQLQWHGAITRALHPAISLALGFSAGYSSRQFNPQKLSFGSQFTDIYRPSTPSGEIFEQTSVGYLDLATGLNAHVRFKPLEADVGLAYHHLNQPRVSFMGSDATLFPALTFYGLGGLALSEKTDVLFNTVYRKQQVYNELVISSGLKYYLNRETNQNIAVSMLLGMRKGDAFFPEFHIYFKNWTGGLSYDINRSDFRVATAGKGGPEFSIRYIANQVVPPKKSKICPIF